MTEPQPRRITSRGKYVGMLETGSGLVIYFRMEHLVTGHRWITNGPLLSLVLSDDQVVGEAWYNALAGASERAMRTMLRTRAFEDEGDMLPGIG